jgi:hypothetical protein
MDSYVEGYLWPDVHNALASNIGQPLVPKLNPTTPHSWKFTWLLNWICCVEELDHLPIPACLTFLMRSPFLETDVKTG